MLVEEGSSLQVSQRNFTEAPPNLFNQPSALPTLHAKAQSGLSPSGAYGLSRQVVGGDNDLLESTPVKTSTKRPPRVEPVALSSQKPPK